MADTHFTIAMHRIFGVFLPSPRLATDWSKIPVRWAGGPPYIHDDACRERVKKQEARHTSDTTICCMADAPIIHHPQVICKHFLAEEAGRNKNWLGLHRNIKQQIPPRVPYVSALFHVFSLASRIFGA